MISICIPKRDEEEIKYMNKVALLFVGMMCCSAIASQSLMKPQDKVFNLGVKAGMRSIYPDISSIEPGGTNVSVEDIRFKHYVGYTAELMMRVNIDRFFIQPSASWNISQADILFDVLLPVSENCLFIGHSTAPWRSSSAN